MDLDIVFGEMVEPSALRELTDRREVIVGALNRYILMHRPSVEIGCEWGLGVLVLQSKENARFYKCSSL